jgi:hypothetical protein
MAEQPPDPLIIRHIVESARLRRLGSTVAGEVSQAEHDRRLGVCLYCDSLDPDRDYCRAAGQTVHAKCRLAVESCPRSLW